MNNNSNTVQTFWVSIGSFFSIIFSLVSTIILSRYLLKEDYGTYGQVIFVYDTLLIVFTLGLPKVFAYFLPRIPIDEAKNLIKKLTLMLFLFGGIFSGFLFLFAQPISVFLKNPDLETALRIFSPVPLLMLPTMGLDGILSTYRKTQFLTVYIICTRILLLCSVIFPVIFLNGNYVEALIGFVIASFISFWLALYFKFLPLKNAGNKVCKLTFKEIFNFSLPLLNAGIWGILILSVDKVFISRFFGVEVFAEFKNGSLELPFVGMIVGACSLILLPVYSRINHENINPKKEIFPIWKSVFEKTVKLTYPIILYCWFFADIIMVVLYGKIYENSAIYFRIKTIVNLFTIISFFPLIVSIGKVKYYANVHLYSFFILVLFEYLSIILINSPYIITVISVICQIGRIFAFLWIIAKFFDKTVYQLFPKLLLLKIVIPSALFLYIIRLITIDLMSLNNITVLIVGLLFYAVIYFIYTYFLKFDYYSLIKPILNQFIKSFSSKKDSNSDIP